MKLISDCSECVIKTFMDFKYDHKEHVLIIEGKPTKEELYNAFDSIETEFNDLCGTASEELKQADKINALVARNKSVELSFFGIDICLQHGLPWLEVLPKLKENNVRITWNNDIEDYKRQVAAAKIRNITKEVELEELTKELETLQKQSTKSAEFTKKNFYELILAIESVLGVEVSENKTNMFKFGVMCSQFFGMTRKQKPN